MTGKQSEGGVLMPLQSAGILRQLECGQEEYIPYRQLG